MAAPARKLESEHARALERLKDCPWLRGVGIGLVDDRPGVVISVAREGAVEAAKILKELALKVPARVRVLGPVRKQSKR